MTGSVHEIVSELTEDLERKSVARDKALVDTRKLVRQAAMAIRALHRGDAAEATSLLSVGRAMVEQIRADLKSFPDLYWSGYVLDAQKEYAEASVVAALISGAAVPTPAELNVETSSYLNGLAEAASEMRRYVLDVIRHGGAERHLDGERALALMDDIYTALIAVDFPDALTGGLRRTTDLVRGVLERTRGDLTMSLRQAQLERALTKQEG
ncbi:MAG TPA: haloacid dehalogenase [Chloroflexota bacterium]|jgi:translin|nr:haloacid dehalogenase [Chloroflexota bacterium]